MGDFDVIVEESPKMIGGEDGMDSSIGVSDPGALKNKR